MKGYLKQLWNDPAFFANAMRSLLGAALLGTTTVMGMPIGRSLSEKIVLGIIAAIGSGIVGLPSAKKDE
jgi:hypothetical protein